MSGSDAVEREHIRPQDLRPHQGGDADFVEFGITLRAISNIDMKVGSYNADVVTTWRWSDERNARLVQKGHKNVTISDELARKRIWLPDVGVTNYASGSVDIVSSSIVIERTGVTTKVERCLAVLKTPFSARAFPFDSQVLRVTVGSRTFMAGDLQLSPMQGPAWTIVEDDVMNTTEFSLTSFDLSVFEEVDGMLHKSRGQLSVNVLRDPTTYIGGSIVPELLVLAISYSVFWFPLTAPFAMPRVATALIAFLSLLTLNLKTNAILPRAAGLTWIDLFECSVQSLMFFTVCLNILALASSHSFDAPHVATGINNELKIVFPVLVFCVFGGCAWARDGRELPRTTAAIQLILVVYAGGYIGWCLWRLWTEVHVREQKEQEAAAKKEAAAADATGSAVPGAS
eukprot:TRINITY_DN14818_c0_g1_i2.p1 TRINITY_DN14818_c0_g1~~TRINITY_DN14818_c0_g1_i2.p1  ORF type:complete len:400 (+),score=74.03 TRINITY_DN14818_c0_g1_i2:97-1296(+)